MKKSSSIPFIDNDKAVSLKRQMLGIFKSNSKLIEFICLDFETKTVMCGAPNCCEGANPAHYTKYNKYGFPNYRTIVVHGKKIPICVTFHNNTGKVSRNYNRYIKKNYCENWDGVKYGFPCIPSNNTKTVFPASCLQVDHLDGDHDNDDHLNLFTACAFCHQLKTIKNKDIQRTQKRNAEKKFEPVATLNSFMRNTNDKLLRKTSIR